MEIFLIIFIIGAAFVITKTSLSSSGQRSNSHSNYHVFPHGLDHSNDDYSPYDYGDSNCGGNDSCGCDSGGCDSGGCGGGD